MSPGGAAGADDRPPPGAGMAGRKAVVLRLDTEARDAVVAPD
jgi:hypothetical protein